jgi:ATP-dependent Clp protease adaptor protein ClpS
MISSPQQLNFKSLTGNLKSYCCNFVPYYIMNYTKPFSIEEEDTDVMVEDGNNCQLIVWNDEVNTFDWVIDTLIEICGHTPEQAEQCAMFIHTKGKYAVKNGSYEVLKPMCDSITDRGIGATVEELSAR